MENQEKEFPTLETIESFDISKPPISPDRKKKKQIIKYKIKDKGKKHYIFAISTMVASIVVFFILWFIKAPLVVRIVYTLLAIPIFLVSNAITLIKLFLDRRKIGNTITKSLSRNYIIARFHYDNMKEDEVIKPVNSNQFEYKDGIYFIESDKILRNTENRPILEYDVDNPSPKMPLQNTRARTYNPQNLKKFQKDKFFSELHRNPSPIDTGVIVILLALAILGIVLVLIFTRGNNA
jgi:hypothetical protein